MIRVRRCSIMLNNRSMEEQNLPSIGDMYSCTRENHDYNVIRAYQGRHKNFGINSKPTKKDHYLDRIIRLDCSPGPANTANQQLPWTRKNPFQSKRAEKQTYLDQIYKREGKNGSPSPNHYSVTLPWPKRKEQLKNVSEKTNFADTCQYYSDKTPGPGTYNVVQHLGAPRSEKKWEAHQPIKPREASGAEVATYSPVPVDYDTFARHMLTKSQSHPNLETKVKGDKGSKENRSPGPASYSTVSYWGGKSPSKKKEKDNEVNFFKCLSKGPSQGIYH